MLGFHSSVFIVCLVPYLSTGAKIKNTDAIHASDLEKVSSMVTHAAVMNKGSSQMNKSDDHITLYGDDLELTENEEDHGNVLNSQDAKHVIGNNSNRSNQSTSVADAAGKASIALTSSGAEQSAGSERAQFTGRATGRAGKAGNHHSPNVDLRSSGSTRNSADITITMQGDDFELTENEKVHGNLLESKDAKRATVNNSNRSNQSSSLAGDEGKASIALSSRAEQFAGIERARATGRATGRAGKQGKALSMNAVSYKPADRDKPSSTLVSKDAEHADVNCHTGKQPSPVVSEASVSLSSWAEQNTSNERARLTGRSGGGGAAAADTQPASNSANSGDSKWIMYVVIGFVFLLVFCLVLFMLFRKKSEDSVARIGEGTTISNEAAASPGRRSMLMLPTLDPGLDDEPAPNPSMPYTVERSQLPKH